VTRTPAYLVTSALGWLGFVAVTAWTIPFLAGVLVPRTVDGPARTSPPVAVAVDLALLGLFAAQHSVMARGSVKAWMRRRVPAPLERTTYVLATDACLGLLLWLWQPFGGSVWHVASPLAPALGSVLGSVLWALCAAGWALAVAATGYIVVGVRFEERDLRRTFGEAYDAYAARVPALLPRLPRLARRSLSSA
jgi:protein-S-isoprenylcysteine O-methyltransferase Ste14